MTYFGFKIVNYTPKKLFGKMNTNIPNERTKKIIPYPDKKI